MAPPSRSNDSSLALVSCLSRGYKFVSVLQYVGIVLVEINVKGFLLQCAENTSIYGQNHKVANSERYWTPLTKQKLSGVI